MAQRAIESGSPRTATRAAIGRPVLLGWLALIAVYVLWGTTFNAIALGDRTMPPLLLTGTRFLTAGLILFLIAGRGRAPWRFPRRHWVAAVITGLLMPAGGTGLVAVAEARIPGGVAALLVTTVPIWTLVIDAIVTHTRMRPAALFAIVLGLAGVVILVRPTPALHLNLVGIGIALIASVSWAAGSVYSKYAGAPRSPFLASGMQLLAAGVFLLLAGLATGQAGLVDLDRIGWTGILALTWLIVAGSLAAYSCYLIALRLLPLAVVSTYAFVNPLVAVTIGAGFFGEPLNLQVGIAALFTVAAIALLLMSRRGERGAGH